MHKLNRSKKCRLLFVIFKKNRIKLSPNGDNSPRSGHPGLASIWSRSVSDQWKDYLKHEPSASPTDQEQVCVKFIDATSLGFIFRKNRNFSVCEIGFPYLPMKVQLPLWESGFQAQDLKSLSNARPRVWVRHYVFGSGGAKKCRVARRQFFNERLGANFVPRRQLCA
jgi:hypothetical protein